MTKTTTILILFFNFIVSTHSSNGQNLTNQQKIELERQVDSVFHSMILDAENLEYDILSKGVDDNQHAGFITNGTYFASYDSLVCVLKTKSQGIAKQNITIQTERTTALNPSIVLLSACGESSAETYNGDRFIMKFFWTFVYEKINNQWKVIQSHQSGNR